MAFLRHCGFRDKRPKEVTFVQRPDRQEGANHAGEGEGAEEEQKEGASLACLRGQEGGQRPRADGWGEGGRGRGWRSRQGQAV